MVFKMINFFHFSVTLFSTQLLVKNSYLIYLYLYPNDFRWKYRYPLLKTFNSKYEKYGIYSDVRSLGPIFAVDLIT